MNVKRSHVSHKVANFFSRKINKPLSSLYYSSAQFWSDIFLLFGGTPWNHEKNYFVDSMKATNLLRKWKIKFLVVKGVTNLFVFVFSFHVINEQSNINCYAYVFLDHLCWQAESLLFSFMSLNAYDDALISNKPIFTEFRTACVPFLVFFFVFGV